MLPVDLYATLAAGLPPESRSRRKISGKRLTLTEEILAGILDGINMLVWINSKDGAKGQNRPASILEKLTEKPREKENLAFSTAEDFEARKGAILKGKNNG